jgi:RimJ/RimL family protein N-acetyltransferase
MLAVRPATEDDAAFIVAAHELPHARGFVLPPTEDDVRAAFAKPDRATLILTADGVAAGMVLLGFFPDPPWLVELRRIIVTQPGRGIGTFAMRWVVAHAFDTLAAHRIWLDVVESNAVARRLYERAGFVHEGTYRDGYREIDGRYANLCMYGLLASDPRQTPSP